MSDAELEIWQRGEAAVVVAYDRVDADAVATVERTFRDLEARYPQRKLMFMTLILPESKLPSASQRPEIRRVLASVETTMAGSVHIVYGDGLFLGAVRTFIMLMIRLVRTKLTIDVVKTVDDGCLRAAELLAAGNPGVTLDFDARAVAGELYGWIRARSRAVA